MPTENRSSNTELVSVPRDLLARVSSTELGISARKDRYAAAFEVRDLLAQPAPQPRPEPIAWMVGTAIWWTKEEAERDAAATGLPIVGLGPITGIAPAEQQQGAPVGEVVAFGKGLHEIAWAAGRMPKLGAKLYTHADPAEADRLRSELAQCEAMAAMIAEREWAEHVGTGPVSSKVEDAFTQLHNDLHEAGEKLAEQDALLREKSGDLIRLAAHLISAPLFALQDLQHEDKKMTRARVDKAVDTADARLKDAAYELRRIADALSASAGPSSPTWSCQACQVEQPTDRACDACGGQTALIAAKS